MTAQNDVATASRHPGKAAWPLNRVPASWSWASRAEWFVPVTGIVLVSWYALRYLGDPSLPGNSPVHPLGWWGWFDQSMALRSTDALVHGKLDPSQHHYPLGYSLLGTLLYSEARNHPFFFVDLLSLLGAFAGFVAFARRVGLAPPLAATLFAVATMGDGTVFRQWVVPWSTTPVAAFLWLLFARCAAWLDAGRGDGGRRRPFLAGLLAGGIVACRPTDTAVVLPCLAVLAWADWLAPRRDRLPILVRRWGLLVAGAAAVLVPIAALHLAIYGPAQSPYMRSSAEIGFTLHDLGWKAYVLLVDPYPWFADGEGLLQHAHWIALGLAGLLPALLRGAKDRLLAAALIAHGILYIAYVDLLPTGLWRFLNVHYFAWTIPGYALLGALLVRDLGRAGWARRVALTSLVATALVLCLRVVPAAVAEDRPAKAVDFAGLMPPFFETFLAGRMALRDARGELHDYKDIRVFLYPGGVRVIGLRRDLVGPVEWLPGHAPQGFEGTVPSARWADSIQLAWPPHWLRRASPPGIPVPAS